MGRGVETEVEATERCGQDQGSEGIGIRNGMGSELGRSLDLFFIPGQEGRRKTKKSHMVRWVGFVLMVTEITS